MRCWEGGAVDDEDDADVVERVADGMDACGVVGEGVVCCAKD